MEVNAPVMHEKLTEIFTKLSHIEHAITFLQWDQLVMMPEKGNEKRSEALAELHSIYHSILTDQETSALVNEPYGTLPDEQKRAVAEMKRVWERATCLPPELVKKKSLAGSRCEFQWRKQREENNWPGFLENFKEVVSLAREEAQARTNHSTHDYSCNYDAMLDLYCTGDSSTMINKIFAGLKAELPTLLQHIAQVHQQRPVHPTGVFPIGQQKRLNSELVRLLGFDFSQGRIDESKHPFSTGDFGDQRITTRYTYDEFTESLKATAHETGHASYEGGLPSKYVGLPVGSARNSCIHESQSLLFEKQILLSQPFLEFFTPTIHQYLPDAQIYNANQLWQSMTRVKPSFIRVDADEVSYPLHIILRYEIEKDLINGTVEPEDIPELWDQKMFEYLGLRTTDDYRNGCLQDIHWTDGSFGYFPAYTLGSINSVQIFSAIKRAYPDWQARLLIGDVIFIREWLEANIWSIGSLKDSQELIQQATGEQTNSRYFLDYLKERYLDEAY